MTHWSDNAPASASSNWPLRGGKTTNFEGGVRVISFLNGGWLPKLSRGTIRDDLLHISDIFPTLINMADINDTDKSYNSTGNYKNELIDGKNIWNTIIGKNNNTIRTELPIQIATNPILAGEPYNIIAKGDIPLLNVF